MDTSVSIALITAFSTLTAAGIGALCTYKWEFRKQKLAWKREERKNNLDPIHNCLDEITEILFNYDKDLKKARELQPERAEEKFDFILQAKQKNILDGFSLDDTDKIILEQIRRYPFAFEGITAPQEKRRSIEMIRKSVELELKGELVKCKKELLNKLNDVLSNTNIACLRAGDDTLKNIVWQNIINPLFKLTELSESKAEEQSDLFYNISSELQDNIAKAHRRLEELATEL